MTAPFGTVATQHPLIWKKVHTHSEQVYEVFRSAHINMLRSHERRDLNGGESATQLIDIGVKRFRKFIEDISDYPKEVSNAEHINFLENVLKGVSALNWHLANSKPGTDGFYDAILFVDRLCAWFFEILSRSDQILEKYFEELRSK